MGKLNSYLGTAENDYLYAENMMEIGKKTRFPMSVTSRDCKWLGDF